MAKDKFWFRVYSGLLCGKHREKIGNALWEFLWLLDKTTKEKDGKGIVLGGRELKIDDIAGEMDTAWRTVQRNLHKLEGEGYIDLERTQYGLVITVNKSKKWGRPDKSVISQTCQKVSSDVTKSVIRPDKSVTSFNRSMILQDITGKGNIKICFENIWKKFPKKFGKKEAFRHFKASVKTKEDFIKINTALDNYLKSKRVANNRIQDGKTWFNNWEDWVESTEDFCKKCMDIGEYVSDKGYKSRCDCAAGKRKK